MGHSVIISLDTFCYKAEEEGWDLAFASRDDTMCNGENPLSLHLEIPEASFSRLSLGSLYP